MMAATSVLLAGCLFAGPEAPPECGFPSGTDLSFAGRATTAELDVQEVVGDPMSDDPADIYITAEGVDITPEESDQGEPRHRLVCAIYVNDSGFVEITVHPDDGGRFTTPTPFPMTSPPPAGVTRADAIEATLAWLPADLDWTIASVEVGPIGRVAPIWEIGDWSRDLSADEWVWKVFAKRPDYGVEVYIDFVDGSVLGFLENVVD